MKTIVFHYYDGQFSTNPYANRMHPLICAISATRRHNPHADIVVFDNSTQKQDWGKLPDVFQFEVIQTFPMNMFNFGLPLGEGRSMSKLWDIAETKFKYPHVAVYASNYIPLLVDQEYLHMDRLYIGGEGCFSYHQDSERATYTLDGWRGLCLLFAQSRDFQKRMLRFTKGQAVTEYSIAQYMCSQNMYEIHHLNKHDFKPMAEFTEPQHYYCGGIILSHGFCGLDKLKVIAGFKELRKAVNWDLLCELIPEYRNIKIEEFSIGELSNDIKLEEMRKYFGLELKKTTPYWEPENNNDQRFFQKNP